MLQSEIDEVGDGKILLIFNLLTSELGVLHDGEDLVNWCLSNVCLGVNTKCQAGMRNNFASDKLRIFHKYLYEEGERAQT